MQRCPRCTHPAPSSDRFCLACGRALHAAPRRWLIGALLLFACLWSAGAAAPVLRAAATPSPRSSAPAPVQATATPCRFVLGFKALHDSMPARVGSCLDNERFLPLRGEAIQHTSGGLLVWRRADNSAAFTDGAQTWLLGPDGLQRRPNDRRFPWEANHQHLPVIRQAATAAKITEP